MVKYAIFDVTLTGIITENDTIDTVEIFIAFHKIITRFFLLPGIRHFPCGVDAVAGIGMGALP